MAAVEGYEGVLGEVVALRRYLHQHPESAFEEYGTQKRVREMALDGGVPEANIKVCAKTGLVIDVLGTAEPTGPVEGRKMIAIRADMDCLKMTEENRDLPYRSVVEGNAHMCGHDGHTATAVGAMLLIQAAAAKIPKGKGVRFLFQPSEECHPGGAKPMVAEGCMEGVDEVYGYHNTPHPLGRIIVTRGTQMALSSRVYITIKGKGGHASTPHMTIDPVVCAAQVIVSLQSIVSRQMPSKENIVLSVCMVHGGESPNVIPDSVKLSGTVRTLSVPIFDEVCAKIRQIVNGTCAVYGCTSDMELNIGYPPVVNPEREFEHIIRIGSKVVGPDRVGPTSDLPFMGAEDFSYFLQERPGCFFFVGTHDGTSPPAMLHNPHYNFNDKALPVAAQMFVRLAEDRLGVSLYEDLNTVLPLPDFK
eukprot:comp21013_c1_seq1/m.28206 comp21013_c1_seq1/g.28206  ORF comp21013_c1_seq1/g.28206 comp21013_c1_seq1/m.28206 type:complete len:418 (-) comp21013_c1_seq1:458-1711(-)